LYVLITASGKDKGRLTDQDFTMVDSLAQPLENAQDSAAKPSAETALHTLIYQLYPGVRAVYHVHTVEAALLSNFALTEGQAVEFSQLEMLKGLGYTTHDISVTLPVFPNQQDITKLAAVVKQRLLSHAAQGQSVAPGILIQGHGLYAWGSSPEQARQRLEIWDYLMRYQWQALCFSRHSV
jgi:methylthioribulose-1-phosphate dehydratase